MSSRLPSPPPSSLLHAAARAALAACCTCVTSAAAQVVPVPFARAPTYAEVVRDLGESPLAAVRPERWEPPPRGRLSGRSSGFDGKLVKVGGELDLRYPALGVVVTIDREDRPLADPPVRLLHLAAPAGPPRDEPAVRTAEGLFIGQPRAQAMAVAARHYRPQQSLASGSGQGDAPTHASFIAEGGRALGWAAPAYHVSLGFGRDERLRELRYDFKPGLTSQSKWALAGAAVVVTGLAAWALQKLWHHHLAAVFDRLPVPGAAMTRLVARGLMAAGAMTALASVGALAFAGHALLTTSGHWATGMVVLVVGGWGLGGLLLAGLLWVVGRRTAALA